MSFHYPHLSKSLGQQQSSINMKTFAFKMKLLPGMEAEYRKRHDAIWPELVQLLRDAGIAEYFFSG